MGWGRGRGSGAVNPALTKHVASEAKDEYAVMKEQRKLREEKKGRGKGNKKGKDNKGGGAADGAGAG